MTYKELHREIASLIGFDGIADDKYFLINFPELVNRANVDVSRATSTPLRYMYLENYLGASLPYPLDAWESGIQSVKYDYRNSGLVLKSMSLDRAENVIPGWNTDNAAKGIPEFYIYQANESKITIRLYPTPTAQVSYAVYYRAKPLEMYDDNHEPLQVLSSDGVTRLSTSEELHDLVAKRAAYLYCQNMQYRPGVNKEMRDSYSNRAQQLLAETKSDKEDATALVGSEISIPTNSFWDV